MYNQPTANSQQPTANSQQPTANSHNHVLVSIIIPAYNTEKYIHRAIESSLRQTHNNVEVIVVNDGSKDNTLEVAKSYEERDSRVRVYHKENGGVSSARNMGIREAHGEYITFLDSDDWFEDCAVEFLLDMQINHPNKFIAADLYRVRYDESENDFRRKVYNRKEKLRDMSVEETLASINAMKFYFLHSKIYITEVIRKHKLHFHEYIHYGEDLLFNFEYLCKTNGLFYTNKPILNILSRSDSAMRVPYDQRKIFIDGKLNDYLQVMVDEPDNTPEITRLMKIHHTRRWTLELKVAFERGADYGRIKQVRRSARMYTHEYLKADTVSLRDKLNLLYRAYLPVFIAKSIFMLKQRIQSLKRKSENRNEEIIPYW
ncbi:MAG: glycosyltransferase [Synergistaceae bacterium]|nr:glycosyltransferase [Synergistaceae bacterium]MBQ3448841.1 glycosyltransferase [Synergistaceae bacterium]